MPTLHELRTAHHITRALHAPSTSLADARDSFRALPSDGLYSVSDFERGTAILASLRLIELEDDEVTVTEEVATVAAAGDEAGAQMLLDLLLERSPPDWLSSAATGEDVRTALVPENDLGAIDGVITDPALRDAILLRAARRFDAERLKALGDIGEVHVYERCREELIAAGEADLAEQVVRVSLISDQLGYDVAAPRVNRDLRRLEVKTTRRLTWQSRIFVSRNEFEVGLKDPDWALVVVEVDPDGQPSVAGWCRAARLEPMMPVDPHAHGRWVSCALLRADNLLEADLPEL